MKFQKFSVISLSNPPPVNGKAIKVVPISERITSLSAKSLQALHDANTAADEMAYQSLGLSGKNTDAHLQELKAHIMQPDPVLFRKAWRSYRSDITKITMHKWYEEKQVQLSDDVTWAKYFALCGKDETMRKQVIALKARWSKQEEYAHWNSAALMKLATEVLPVFKEYHNLLRLELKYYRRKLNKTNREAIKQYLDKLGQEIKDMECDLASTMLSRLEAASDSGDLRYSDVTTQIINELHTLGVLDKEQGRPKQARRELDRKTFKTFHKYINAHGSSEVKAGTSALRWHQPPKGSTLTAMQYKGRSLLIPAPLLTHVRPTHWFKRLFVSQRQQKKILAKHVYLIAYCDAMPKPLAGVSSLTALEDNTASRDLITLIDRLNKVLQTAQTQKPTGLAGGLEKLFGKDKIAFDRDWESYLQAQRKTLLMQHCNYLVWIAEEIKTSLNSPAEMQALYTSSFSDEMDRLKKESARLIKACGVLAEDLPGYQAFLLQHEFVMSQFKTSNVTLKISNDKKEGLILRPRGASGAEISFEEEAFNPFQANSLPYPFEKLYSLLDRLAPKDITSALGLDCETAAFQSALTDLELFLRQHPPRHGENDLLDPDSSAHLDGLFKTYLLICVSPKLEQNKVLAEDLKRIESILVQLGSKFTRDDLRELDQLKKDRSAFAFKTKCFAMLSSLASDPAEDALYAKCQAALLPSLPPVAPAKPIVVPEIQKANTTFFVDLNKTKAYQPPKSKTQQMQTEQTEMKQKGTGIFKNHYAKQRKTIS